MGTPLELASKGFLAEQWVGQQLLYSKPGYINPELYYWHPPRAVTQAEVDYLHVHNNRIIPLEVKAGGRGSSKSLHSYVIRKQAEQAIRISSARPLRENLTARLEGRTHDFELLNLPFYLVNQIDRLLENG